MHNEPLQEATAPALGRSSRRAFLGQVGGVTAAALGATVAGALPTRAAPLAAAAPATPSTHGHAGRALPVFRGERHMLDDLTQEAFAQHLHSTFRVHQPAGPNVDLTLVEAEYTRHHAPASGLESFSLMFRGPREVALEQETYSMEHEHLGEMALFIVPMGIDEQGRYYQCIFNRLARG